MLHRKKEKKEVAGTNFLKQKILDNKKVIFFLLVMFIFAVSLRVNLVQYQGDYLFEPDAYYHARLVEQIVTTGNIISPDPNIYYQVPEGVPAAPLSIYHIISAFVYILLAFGGAFNKELLLYSVQVMPAIFGALITISMYFLGKEIFNSKKIGAITAFLAAVTPAFVYRTMAGAQGDNSLGFLWMAIGFIFFVRAVKSKTLTKQDLMNVILAGIFFGIMAMTWELYLLIPLIAIPYFLFGLTLISSKSENKETFIKSESFYFTIKFVIAFVIFSIICYLTGNYWLDGVGNYAGNIVKLSPILTVIGGAILVLAVFVVNYFIQKANSETKKIFPWVVIGLLYVALLAVSMSFIVVQDVQDRTNIHTLVGEESVGNNFFGSKYNSLIVFPWIGLIFLPIGLYFFKRSDSHTQIIFWLWTIITLFMAWYTLKFTFVFGLGIVTGGAITAYLIFELLKKFELGKGIEAKTTVVALFFLVLLGVGAAALFIPDYKPFANSDTRIIDTANWINSNTQPNAKFFNWWSDGHMYAFLTERKFSSDNRNASDATNQLFAEFVVTTDTKRGYEIVSKDIGAEYILVSSDMIFSAGTYEFYFAGEVNSSLVQKYNNSGPAKQIPCSATTEGKNCNGQLISQSEYDKISTTWKNTPDTFYNGTYPLFYYAESNGLYLLNQVLNNTNIAKVWFNSPETTQYYQEVFSDNGIKIFKVIYHND